MVHRPLQVLAGRLPWPGRTLIGVAAIGLGSFLVTRPLHSLDVLAAYLAVSFVLVGMEALLARSVGRIEELIGTGWCVLGLVVLVAPGHAINALPNLVGAVLFAAGLLRAFRSRAGTLDERVASLLFGAAEVILGVVALAWTDVTLVITASVFGIATVLVGASLAVEAVRFRDRTQTPDEAATGRSPIRRWGTVLTAVLAIVLSLGVLGVSSKLRNGGPVIDDFYSAPTSVPSSPGKLLRSERFTRQIPDGAHGWRILYTTTDALDRPVLASAIVVVPTNSAKGPHPVIAWAHGTTGQARQCAPSLLKEPFTDGAFPDVMDQVVKNGWAIVATDYAGLGTEGVQPYIIGKGEAHSVLDAVRAARELHAVELSTSKTMVWGHSQGGGAALWTDQEQPTYAPDVPLAGTVAMAPAADPLALAKNLPTITGGTVFGSFVYAAYAATYPDLKLSNFVQPAAIPLVKKIASRCLSEPGVLASVLTALALGDQNLLSTDPTTGAVGARLRENIPRTPGPGPLLIAQGLADGLVLPTVTDGYVAQLRADGHEVDYHHYPGLGHMELVQARSALLPELIAWTAARFG